MAFEFVSTPSAPVKPVKAKSSPKWKILPKPSNSVGLTTVLVPSATGGKPQIAFVKLPSKFFQQMKCVRPSALMNVNLCENCKGVFPSKKMFVEHVQKCFLD